MKYHNKYKKKIEATKGKATPTLSQIQDFLRNLRCKLGDINNTGDIINVYTIMITIPLFPKMNFIVLALSLKTETMKIIFMLILQVKKCFLELKHKLTVRSA